MLGYGVPLAGKLYCPQRMRANLSTRVLSADEVELERMNNAWVEGRNVERDPRGETWDVGHEESERSGC